jgi:hypothetical protein
VLGVQEERTARAAGAGSVLPGRYLPGIPHGVHHPGNNIYMVYILKTVLKGTQEG